ncbi:MAG: outer membrane lipoprotein carrier protein LolA [Muribaculaceae bacterium]|nr:outer membrane lipoprotein carrier protein LolA [Muribaculaceae bacterium]
MKKYSYYIIYIILLMIAAPLYAQNGKCNILLDNVIKEYDASNGVSANFSICTESNGYASETSGKIVLNGKMFSFTTTEMECGYDGETLWTYIKNNNEINLSIPEEEEIININPYLLIKNYSKRFKCSFAGKSGDMETVVLSPKSSADNIVSVKVTINSKLLCLSRIEVANKDNSKIVIKVSDYNSRINVDKAKFSFDKKKYPNIEIIDLR